MYPLLTRVVGSPLVLNGTIGFYYGVPLVLNVRAGYFAPLATTVMMNICGQDYGPIGSFCVIDHKPRVLKKMQESVIQNYARKVTEAGSLSVN